MKDLMNYMIAESPAVKFYRLVSEKVSDHCYSRRDLIITSVITTLAIYICVATLLTVPIMASTISEYSLQAFVINYAITPGFLWAVVDYKNNPIIMSVLRMFGSRTNKVSSELAYLCAEDEAMRKCLKQWFGIKGAHGLNKNNFYNIKKSEYVIAGGSVNADYSCFLCDFSVKRALDNDDYLNGNVCKYCPLKKYGERYKDREVVNTQALCVYDAPWGNIQDIIRGDKDGDLNNEVTTFIGELVLVHREINNQIKEKKSC